MRKISFVIAVVIITVGAVLGMGAGSSICPYMTNFIRNLLDDATQGDARTTLGVGTGDSTEFVKVTLSGNEINIATAQTPASATAAGTAGDLAWDTDYIYVAVAGNTWKRSALSTWGTTPENVIYAGEDVIFAGEQIVYP